MCVHTYTAGWEQGISGRGANSVLAPKHKAGGVSKNRREGSVTRIQSDRETLREKEDRGYTAQRLAVTSGMLALNLSAKGTGSLILCLNLAKLCAQLFGQTPVWRYF